MMAEKTLKKKSWPRRIWSYTWKIALGLFLFSILLVIAYRWINPPITFLQISERMSAPEGCECHQEWVDSENISVYMKLAVVSSEDNNFMKHNGFDWGAIEKARKYNETHKGKKRGASTISQQTAKNVFLWPSRSWIRKGFEVYFTFLIELFWSKERIMEVYLNVIEMGQCKFGVGAAAKDYFRTTADKLTPEQAALIAGCLPNPKKFNPGAPSAYLRKRQGQITRLMRLIGYNYFERYKEDVPEEKRAEEEKAIEKKIDDEKIDLPVIEENSEAEPAQEPAQEQEQEPVQEREQVQEQVQEPVQEQKPEQ